jgi:putative transposase
VVSRRLRAEFPGLRRHHWRARGLWSGSYSADSLGGAPTPVLCQLHRAASRPS